MNVVHASAQIDIDERRQRMEQFGKSSIIVASNILSRAIDIEGLRVVINYDLPCNKKTFKFDNKTYKNRMGRCSRFGENKNLLSSFHEE